MCTLLQANLESLMRAASESRRLVCLDIRGAVFGAAGIQPILQMLHKCSGLRELRVSVSHESDKSELLLGAAEANPRCMLVVTAQASAEACENALVIQTREQADTLQSLPDSDGTASERPGCMMALVERTQGGAVAKAGTHLRRARCSTASASLKCSQQSRRAFKQTSGLCKGSSAGGAAQRGAQVFMRADRRGTGSARLKDLSKALKAFKIDGFSSKKVQYARFYVTMDCDRGGLVYRCNALVSDHSATRTISKLALRVTVGSSANSEYARGCRWWRSFDWRRRRSTK